MRINDNLTDINRKIEQACARVNRSKEDITIIGVTKYVTIERTEELLESGVINLGENRSEELTKKYNIIGRKANWHFIGTLQSRKVKDIIDKVSTIHSLDRLSIAKQIDNRAIEIMDCFVQVNVSEEESKHGLSINEVIPFIKELSVYNKIRVIGLMTMAPHITNKDKIRNVFKELALLRDEVRALEIKNIPCDKLSMGMSNDYEIAIEEGATHIRIGTSLVGNPS